MINRIDTARKQYKTQLLDKMTPKNVTFVDLVEFDKTGDLVKSVRKRFFTRQTRDRPLQLYLLKLMEVILIPIKKSSNLRRKRKFLILFL